MKDYVSSREIFDAITKNNIETTINIFDKHGFDGLKSKILNAREETVLKQILGAASAMADNYRLDKDLSDEIIHRVAPLISQRIFLELAEIDTGRGKLEMLEENIIKILKRTKEPSMKELSDLYSSDVTRLKSITTFVLENDIAEIPKTVWETLLQAMRNHEFIPNELLYSFMSMSLTEPVFGKEEVTKSVFEAFLDSLFPNVYD